MFFMLFQLFSVITLGILKGFWTENTENTNKTVFSRQDKIALQGAVIDPRMPGKQSINNTVFLDSRIFRCCPLYAAESVCSVRDLSRTVFSG